MDVKTALNYARDACARMEQCRLDVTQKLRKSELDEPLVSQIIEILEKEGFIDEKRYARSFCQEKFRLNKWGRIKLRYMLRQKRIGEQAIEEALSGINQEDYLELLGYELMKKAATLKNTAPVNKRNKLIGFARQRGFEYESISAALESLSL